MDSPSTPTKNDANMWAMLCHLSALAGYIIPFGSIIGPLVIWQMKKAEFPLVDDQGKEALNFQITVGIAAIICIALIIVVIGIPMLLALGVANLVFIILGSLKANKGEAYRYPFAFRFVK